jgi:hypothetical protein
MPSRNQKKEGLSSTVPAPQSSSPGSYSSAEYRRLLCLHHEHRYQSFSWYHSWYHHHLWNHHKYSTINPKKYRHIQSSNFITLQQQKDSNVAIIHKGIAIINKVFMESQDRINVKDRKFLTPDKVQTNLVYTKRDFNKEEKRYNENITNAKKENIAVKHKNIERENKEFMEDQKHLPIEHRKILTPDRLGSDIAYKKRRSNEEERDYNRRLLHAINQEKCQVKFHDCYLNFIKKIMKVNESRKLINELVDEIRKYRIKSKNLDENTLLGMNEDMELTSEVEMLIIVQQLRTIRVSIAKAAGRGNYEAGGDFHAKLQEIESIVESDLISKLNNAASIGDPTVARNLKRILNNQRSNIINNSIDLLEEDEDEGDDNEEEQAQTDEQQQQQQASFCFAVEEENSDVDADDYAMADGGLKVEAESVVFAMEVEGIDLDGDDKQEHPSCIARRSSLRIIGMNNNKKLYTSAISSTTSSLTEITDSKTEKGNILNKMVESALTSRITDFDVEEEADQKQEIDENGISVITDAIEEEQTQRGAEDANRDEQNPNNGTAMKNIIFLLVLESGNDDGQDEKEQDSNATSTKRPYEQVDVADDVEEIVIVEGSRENSIDLLEDEEDQAQNDEDDIQIIGSKGNNALSDFPHSREDCVTNLFTIDPHKFCSQCYCFVCDVKAVECTKWDIHCQAQGIDRMWKQRRINARSKRNRTKLKTTERALQRLHTWSSSLPTDLPTKRVRKNVDRF